MQDPVIDVQNLSFSHDGRTPLLSSVSFQIFPGEKIGIFGPNGGGKTTLLKLLLGFCVPASGSISILGKPPQKSRKKIGYVPQNLKTDKAFPISVFDVVMMGLLDELSFLGRFSKNLKEKGMQALQHVGLQDLHAHAFGTLSGGQAQRVLIARALVSEPQILILDEATAHIDPKASEEINRLLFDLSPKVTLILVTHDLQMMLKYFDRLLCVQNQVSSLLPKDVCEHFALGLYHTPLLYSTHVKFP
jgi:zinc transport system ATP-binding protein